MSYALRRGTRANDTLIADNIRSRVSTTTSLNTGTLSVENDAGISGNLVVDGTTTIGGGVDIGGSAQIDGALGVGGALDVSGSGTFGGALDVAGDSVFDGDVVIRGDLTVVKESTLSETTYVHNDIFYTVAQTIEQPATFFDDVTICGTLTCSAIDLSGDITADTIICNDQLRFPSTQIRITEDATPFVSQGTDTIAIGRQAGTTSQGAESIAIGHQAGQSSQGTQSVAVGHQAGETSQGIHSVAVGYYSGVTNQGNYAVAVGRNAAQANQGLGAVAVGNAAGDISQGTLSVAVGYFAGYDTQGTESVAVGHQAGRNSQGQYAVAVGFKAGLSGQADNSIVLNAQSTQLDSTTSGFFVKPVREQENTVGWTPPGTLWYEPSTGELASQPDISQGTIAVDLTISGDLNVRGDINGDPGSVLTLRNTFPTNPYGYIHLLTSGAKDIYFGISDATTDPQGYNINANIGGGNDFGVDFFGKTGISTEELICRFAVSTTDSGYQPESGHGGLTVEDTIKSDRLLVDTELGINIIPSGGNVLDVSGDGRVRGDFRVDGSFNIGPASVTMWEDAGGNLTMAHSTAPTAGININLHDSDNTAIDSGDSSRGILIGPKDVPASTIHISKDGKIGIGKHIEGDASLYKTLDISGDVEIDGGLFIHGSEIGVSGIDTSTVTTRQLQLYNLSDDDAVIFNLATSINYYDDTIRDRIDTDLTHGTISSGQWIELSNGDEHTVINHSTIHPTIHARIPPNHAWYGSKLSHVNYDVMCDTGGVNTGDDATYGVAGRDFGNPPDESDKYASFDIVLPAWLDSSDNYTFPEGTSVVIYGKGLAKGPNSQRTFLRLIVPGYNTTTEEGNVHLNFSQISPDISYGLAKYIDQEDPGEGASALSRIPNSSNLWFDLTSVPPMRNLEMNAWMRDSNGGFDNQYPDYAPGTVNGFAEDNTKCIWKCECVSTTHGWIVDRFTITNGEGNTTIPQNLVVKKDANVTGDLLVDGDISTNSTLYVAGTTTLGSDANVTGDLLVDGDISTNSNAYVTGTTTLHTSTIYGELTSLASSINQYRSVGTSALGGDIKLVANGSQSYIAAADGSESLVTFGGTNGLVSKAYFGTLITSVGFPNDDGPDISTFGDGASLYLGNTRYNQTVSSYSSIPNLQLKHTAAEGAVAFQYLKDKTNTSTITIEAGKQLNDSIELLNDTTINGRATVTSHLTCSSISTTGGSISGGAVFAESLKTNSHIYFANANVEIYSSSTGSYTDHNGASQTNSNPPVLVIDVNNSPTQRAVYVFDATGGTSTFFTGSHFVCMDTPIIPNQYGLIVSSLGSYYEYRDNNNAWVNCSISTRKKDKRVYGVLTSTLTNHILNTSYPFLNNLSTVNSVGEGTVFVANTNGNIENGDYISTSFIPGIGELQDEPMMCNFTVAKATIDISFEDSIPVDTIYTISDERYAENGLNMTISDYKYTTRDRPRYDIYYVHITGTYYAVYEEPEMTTELFKFDYDFSTYHPDKIGNVYKCARIGCTYHCG